MSIQFQAPALSPPQRYLTAVLLQLRRLVNRSVANMLASRERLMLEECGDREPGKGDSAGNRTGVRAVLFGLIVAGSLSPAAAKAEGSVVRDHRGGRVQQVSEPRCGTGNQTHMSDGGCITASGSATVGDHRSR